MAMVVLPATLYSIYLFLVASPQYESEFRIQIKSPGGGNMPSFGQLLGFTGASTPASDNGYAVTQYLESSDAIDDLDKMIGLRKLYSASFIDPLSRAGKDATGEAFQRYWNRRLSVHFESTTGTVVVTVAAFSPKDAQSIALGSLHLSETLLNTMTARARTDSVRYAEQEVRESEDRVKKIEQSLYAVRSQKQMIDASKQVASAMVRIGKLQEEADRAGASLALRARYLARGTPGRDLAEAQVQTARAALAAARAEMASTTNARGDTLAGTVSTFDELEASKLFAEKRLQNAFAALSAAQSDAQRQQLYLDTIVRPRLPQEPSYPKPFRNISTFFLFAAGGWAILLLIGSSIRDHIRV